MQSQIKIRKYWFSTLFSLSSTNIGESEKVFHELVNRYSEEHRAYHTLEHIITMLDDYTRQGKPDPALMLAILFHDAIYDTQAKDNEEQSALFAKEGIQQMELGNSLAEEVHELILWTKHAKVPGNDQPKAKLLVDLDLAILGAPAQEFDLYEIQIRKEYEWVPEDTFCKERIKILESFLGRATIYSTFEIFYQKENIARANLYRSIAKLRN